LTSGHGVKNQSLYLQACAHLKSGQTRLAREKLESIWSGHDLAERATRLLWEVERAEEIPHKSPVVAGLLSIVPGLGHFYMEDYAVAITALTWNGLFGFATYDAFRRSSYGVGAVLAALELFWYSGTIYGAVAEAHRYNRDARKNYIERLDEAIGLDVDFPDSRVVGGILLEGEF